MKLKKIFELIKEQTSSLELRQQMDENSIDLILKNLHGLSLLNNVFEEMNSIIERRRISTTSNLEFTPFSGQGFQLGPKSE